MNEQAVSSPIDSNDSHPTVEQKEQYPEWIDLITNNDQRTVYIHRTSQNLASKIQETGFKFGVMLSSTATASSADPELAMGYFKMIHHAPGAGVIIHLPIRLYDSVNKAEQIFLDDVIFDKYFDEQQGNVVIPREWIVGYADQTSLEFTPNPHYNPCLPDPVPEVRIDPAAE